MLPFRLRMGIVCSCYEQPQVHENQPLCLENKHTACSQKKPSYSSCKINGFVLFCFVLFNCVLLCLISHPFLKPEWKFHGKGEGMKVYGMNLPEASQVLPLATVALGPTGDSQNTNTREKPSRFRSLVQVSVRV